MGHQNYATPPDFWDVVDAEFKFQLDAAADEANRKCHIYLSEAHDALKTCWVTPLGNIQRVWCNPPFRKMMPWVERAIQESQKHPSAVVVLLGPLSNAKWYEVAKQRATEIRRVTPRIQFVPPAGIEATDHNDRDQVLMIFRPKPLDAPDAVEWLWKWKTNSKGDDK